jgi:hypothetical protein
MILPPIKNIFNLIKAIKKETCLFLKIQLMINYYNSFRKEVKNIFIVFRYFCLRLVNLMISDIYRKGNYFFFIKCEKHKSSNLKRYNLSLTIVNFVSLLYIKTQKKINNENLFNQIIIKKFQCSLKNLKKLKNLYRKNFGIKFKKKNKILFIFYSNTNSKNSYKNIIFFLKKDIFNKFFAIRTMFLNKKNNKPVIFKSKSLTLLLIYLRELFESEQII